MEPWEYLDVLFFDVASPCVSRFAYALSIELGEKNINSLALSPGWTLAERMTELTKDEIAQTHSAEYLELALLNLLRVKNVMELNGKTHEIGNLARGYGFADQGGKVSDYHSIINWRENRIMFFIELW